MRRISVVVILCVLAAATRVSAQDEQAFGKIYLGGCVISAGTGSPEGVVVGSVCDRYLRTDTPEMLVKVSGTNTNTGWLGITDSTGKLVGLTSSIFSSLSGASLTSLPAGQLTGTVPASTLTGRSLADLGTRSAADLSSGTLAYARLPSGSGTWSATPTIGGTTTIGGDLLPDAADTRDVGTAALPWRQSFVSQMNATLFAKSTQTLYGGWLAVSKNAGVFAASVSSGATTIDFGQSMTANQFVLVRAADTGATITEEYLKVGTLVSGTTYNVTRNLSGGGAKNWAVGTPYQVRGVSGDGWIELNAFDTPRLSIFTQGSLYNNSTETIRLGYLTGMPNSSSGIGVYMGDSTNYFRWDGSSLIVQSADATIDSSGLTLGSSGGYASYYAPGALKFRYDISKFTGVTLGMNVQSRSFGVPLVDESSLFITNAVTGTTGHDANAVVSIAASGWNSAGGVTGGSAAFGLATTASTSFASVTAGLFTINGPTTTTSTITERSRATPMGEWTAPVFSAGDFAGNGAMTWTVDSGDVVRVGYTLVGKTMHLSIYINSTTVGGTANTNLQMTIPGSFTAAYAQEGFIRVYDNGTPTCGIVRTTAGGTAVIINRCDDANFTLATNNTAVQGEITFEVQ